MRSSLRSLAPMLAILASPAVTPLVAQQDEPATIPTSLAVALTGPYVRMFGEAPHFVVGRPPEGWPATLVAPAPATLVGGMTFGPVRSIVFRYPAPVDAAKEYRRVLTRAGYTRGANPMATRGGFTSGEPLDVDTYCAKDGLVTVSDADSSATSRSILVMFAAAPLSSPACGAPSTGMDRYDFPLTLPPLLAPPGVSAQPRGMSRSGNEFSTSVRLDTTLSVRATLDHYARQLSRAGWQVGKALVDRSSGLQTLSTRDSTGAAWSGALTLLTNGAQRTLELTMSATTATAATH